MRLHQLQYGRVFGLALFTSSLVACGAATDKSDPVGFEGVEGGTGDGSVRSEAGPGGDDTGATGDDTDPGSGFDVSFDTTPPPPVDATCAASGAEAIKIPVDIILVVDQSGSMSDDIKNVKDNINKLSGFLDSTKLDYRVIMIAKVGTTTYDVCVPEPLAGKSCLSKAPRFRTVNQLIGSTDALQKILSTYDLKTGDKVWYDMLRPTAIKAFIPITDDDSRSYAATTFDTELLKRGAGTFGTAAKRNYVFYPICGASATDEKKTCGGTMVNTGAAYVTLAKLTKGRWYPLCSKDFATVFTGIAKDIASTVACELAVPPPPDGKTLDYTKINVSYTPSATGSAEEDVLRDDSKPCAAGANGWQFNADKTKVLLCGAACTKVQADLGSRVDVKFGCETVFKPPS